jgi:hypothetical protein
MVLQIPAVTKKPLRWSSVAHARPSKR